MIGVFKKNKINLKNFEISKVKELIKIPKKFAFLVFNYFFKRIRGENEIEEEADKVWVDDIELESGHQYGIDFEAIIRSALTDLVSSHGNFQYSSFVDLVFESILFFFLIGNFIFV